MDRIIINGRACSGKDEIADYLVREHGYTKITFATPIYRIARVYFGMTTKDRTLLQAIGEKLREIDPDVWLKAAFAEAKEYHRVVIADCRRANEYVYAVSNGFTPIRVTTASIKERISRSIFRDGVYPNVDEWENSSETGADNFEYIELSNDGSKEELFLEIDNLLSVLS